MKKKKVVSVAPQPETNGEAHQEETVHTEDPPQPAGPLRSKKRGLKTPPDAELQRAEEKLESDAELSSENQHRVPEPGLKLKKKQRRKRTVSRKTCEDTEDRSEIEISVTSAEIVTSAPRKKRQKLKRKAKGAESKVTSGSLTASAVASPKKKLRNNTSSDTQDTSRKTPVKKKKKKNVVSVAPQPETNGEAHQEETVHTEDPPQPAGRLRSKKSSAAVQIKPARKRMNGHADQTSLKRHKICSVSRSYLYSCLKCGRYQIFSVNRSWF